MNATAARLVTAVVAAIAIAAGVFLYARHERAPTGSDASRLFYAQHLRDGMNVERAMADYRGRVTVVNFWATWCAPCVEEIPSFSRIHAEMGGQVGFVGLGIDSPGNVIGFNERFKPSYPLLAAGASGTELARAFGNTQGALPYTVLLGRDGEVLATRLGKLDEATLRAWLAPHLKAAAGAAMRPPA